MAGKGHISAAFFLYAALMLLILPLPWLLAMMIAAAIHELCHMAAICFFREKPGRLYVGARGAEIQLPEMGRGAELVCALMGPLGSICLLLLARWWPRLALCGLIQGLYNLIPLYPMDGGRILQCLAQILLPPPRARRFVNRIEKLWIIALIAASFWVLVIPGWGILPICLSILLLFQRKYGNTACKPDHLRVQ